MRRNRALLVLVPLVALVASGCGQFGKRFQASNTTTTSTTDTKITTAKFTDASVRAKDGCDNIKTYPSEGRTHTTDIKTKVVYKTNPPTSGNHYAVPAEWGLYDTTQPDVQTVHNLEHGHIVITFKGLTPAEHDTLLNQARKDLYHLLVEPRNANPKNGVFYSVWTHQIYCKRPSAAALQYMIDRYRDQGPELYTQDANNMGSSSNQ